MNTIYMFYIPVKSYKFDHYETDDLMAITRNNIPKYFYGWTFDKKIAKNFKKTRNKNLFTMKKVHLTNEEYDMLDNEYDDFLIDIYALNDTKIYMTCVEYNTVVDYSLFFILDQLEETDDEVLNKMMNLKERYIQAYYDIGAGIFECYERAETYKMYDLVNIFVDMFGELLR